MAMIGYNFTKGQRIAFMIGGIILVILSYILMGNDLSSSDVAKLAPLLITLLAVAILVYLGIIIAVVRRKEKLNADFNLMKLIKNNWLLILGVTVVVIIITMFITSPDVNWHSRFRYWPSRFR